VQGLAGLEIELILIVFGEGPAAVRGSQYFSEIEAGLRICGILIVNGEQPMPLRADVAHLEKDVCRAVRA